MVNFSMMDHGAMGAKMTTRILVADDSTTIQKVIRIAFSRYPVDLLAASTLLEAKSVIQLEPLDLVIMDSCLPGTKGPEDLKRFMDGSQGLPGVFLVGSFQGSDLSSLVQSGLREILKKPFESREIVDVVRSVLGRPLEPSGSEEALPTLAAGISPSGGAEPLKPASIAIDDSSSPVPPPPPSKLGIPNGLSQEDLASVVKSAVYDYCSRHFEDCAKDVITTEIRRLMDQKARQLIDN
jgi:CheY-like chemotaxis protein